LDLKHNMVSEGVHYLVYIYKLSEWSGLTSFISSLIELHVCTTVVVRSVVTGPDSSRVCHASTPKYHAADKHDTPPSHFKLAHSQPAALL